MAEFTTTRVGKISPWAVWHVDAQP